MSDEQAEPAVLPEDGPVIDGDTDSGGYEPLRVAGDYTPDEGPPESLVMDWQIHNDHADGVELERDYGDEE